MTSSRPRTTIQVTISVDPKNVALVDRLAEVQGSTRSGVIRELLEGLTPALEATILAIEQVQARRREVEQEDLDLTMRKLDLLRAQAETLGTEFVRAIQETGQEHDGS